MARKALTKKTRFEVFKRDSFTCQYCGRMAPDVVLEVDHINPVANGGDNEIINLITSCYDCNRGKGKRKLSDKDEIKKQQELLKGLNQKREQLKMMLSWRNELANLDDAQVEQVDLEFENSTGNTLTDHGKTLAKKWIKEFGLIEVLNCLEISAEQYLIPGNKSSINKVFDYIPRIASVRRRNEEDPLFGKHRYISAILRNRRIMLDENTALRELKKYFTNEDDFSEIKQDACICESWNEFCTFLKFYGGDGDGD